MNAIGPADAPTSVMPVEVFYQRSIQ